MNILLVIPKYIQNPGERYDVPLGLLYISSILKSHTYKVMCLNLNLHGSEDILEHTIKENNINIVCTGAISPFYMRIKTILDTVHSISSNIITILGGGIITSEPAVAYELLSPTYGVIGEGEETIIDLMKAIEGKKDFKEVDGLIFRDHRNNVIQTSPRKPIGNLDSIPFPDYDGFEVEKYLAMQMPNDVYFFHAMDKPPRMLPIISSRGCPYNCSFCFHPIGKRYRQRSLDNYFQELDSLIGKYEINFVSVFDELFSVNKKRAYEFCERIEEYKINWMTQMRVDTVDEKVLRLFKESGGCCISYGIESASNKVLKSMKKMITIEQVNTALELTKKHRITIQGNLIVGDTADNMQTVNETIKWFNANIEYTIFLGHISVYPGSPLYYHAIEKGLIQDKKSFIEHGGGSLNVTEMTDYQFNKLKILFKLMNHRAWLKLSGKIIKLVNTAIDKTKGPLYDIEISCPHCGHHNEYKSFNVNNIDVLHGIILVCKNCYQRYFLFGSIFRSKLLLIWYIIMSIFPLHIGVHLDGLMIRLYSLTRFTFRENIIRIKNFLRR